MSTKFDYKKEYKDLYMPKNKPMLIHVPKMSFITVDGKGDPNGNPFYQEAMEILYGLSYTIKMSKMSGLQPEGYFEYVVPPLEGLWWCLDGKFDFDKRENWLWTSMIRQPEFVNETVFLWACETLNKKKPEIDISKAKFTTYEEGDCVQIMHIGPYADEPETMKKVYAFIEENNLVDMTGSIRKHHEIYLSDPRKTEPNKLRTVLRHPVKKLK